MAEPRRLPSGKWRVRVKRGTRVWSFTHSQKQVCARWARDLEVRLDGGEFVATGPAPTLEQVRAAWMPNRVVADSTIAKNDSTWRTHLLERWGNARVDEVDRDDVRAWVKDMERRQLGAWTIDAAVHHLSAIFEVAVEAGHVRANPVRGVVLPTPAPRAPFFWRAEECTAIVAAVREVAGARTALAVDLNFHVGLRLGELFGLAPAPSSVDVDARLLHVTRVMTRSGPRAYPKTRRSARTVPLPPRLLPDLELAVKQAQADDADWLFPAPEGGPWDDSNWRRRVWQPAVATAGVRAGEPRAMRHTAASHLVQAGVDLLKVQQLLGHESFATTQRYASLAPAAHDQVLAAWQ